MAFLLAGVVRVWMLFLFEDKDIWSIELGPLICDLISLPWSPEGHSLQSPSNWAVGISHKLGEDGGQSLTIPIIWGNIDQ